MIAYFKAMRLGRWPRSLAILVGTAAFFFFHRNCLSSLGIIPIILRIAVSFFLTWAISTANYIINEIVDAPYDIHHPVKKNRPLVKGEISKNVFLFVGVVIVFSSLLIAYVFFSLPFFLSLSGLLIAGFIYNVKPIRTKDIPFLDAVSESVNNPIRFLIGWYTFSFSQSFPPIVLLLGWWTFGSFLMIAKRYSEFRILGEKAKEYRSSHKKYSESSLMLGMILSLIIFFGTYFAVALMFQLYYFFYLTPFVFIYFFLIFKKTLSTKSVMEEPEKLLIKPLFACYTVFLIVVFLLGYFLV